MNNIFIHHVFFWLKENGNDEHKNLLVAGLQKLSQASIIRQFHIGKAAGTDRDVIDSSYAVSWMIIFDSGAQQEAYQTDPMHLQFVEECSQLWSKVLVYDSVDA